MFADKPTTLKYWQRRDRPDKWARDNIGKFTTMEKAIHRYSHSSHLHTAGRNWSKKHNTDLYTVARQGTDWILITTDEAAEQCRNDPTIYNMRQIFTYNRVNAERKHDV